MPVHLLSTHHAVELWVLSTTVVQRIMAGTIGFVSKMASAPGRWTSRFMSSVFLMQKHFLSQSYFKPHHSVYGLCRPLWLVHWELCSEVDAGTFFIVYRRLESRKRSTFTLKNDFFVQSECRKISFKDDWLKYAKLHFYLVIYCRRPPAHKRHNRRRGGGGVYRG